MQEFIKVMKALSDPNRVKMIKLLLQSKMLCVCEIKESIGIAQSSTSKHLKILEGAGLIVVKKKGLWVYYRVADETRNPYAANLLGNLRHWLEDDVNVSAMRIHMLGIKRKIARCF